MAPLPVEIAQALDRGATVVTGNQRAARTLRRASDRRNRSLGLVSWSPANVLAWDAWTARLWQRLLMDGRESRLLLNSAQEHSIWCEILASDPELQSLRSRDSLAEMAADAWQQLGRYKGQGRLRGAVSSSDARSFQRWTLEFKRRCKGGEFLPQGELEEALCGAASSGGLSLDTNELVLVGFDRMTPSQTALTGALRSAGCIVEDLKLTAPADARFLIRAEDEMEELVIAARWIRHHLEATPSAKIAVIVPALERRRAEIERVFRDVLAPELHNIDAVEGAGPFEFSLGVPLAQVPLIRAALDLLRWTVEPLPLNRVSALLLSPSFAMSGGERGVRGEFDAFEVRRAQRLRPEVTLDWLSAAAYKSPRRDRLGRLPGVLRAMQQCAASTVAQDSRSYARWADSMREILNAAGWNASSGNSFEFQAQRKWESALDEMTTLSFEGGSIGFVHALESLERIARKTMFAPESHEAPVQIMGTLEASGSIFDAVWFMGAGDLTWPIAARNNPLLPWHLQRDLRMPSTDVSRDSEDARRVTERIAASARTTVFSFAIESAEGSQRPSPALATLHLDETDAETLAGPGSERSIVELESIEDATPVQALPDQVIRGGSYLLKLQAACGFRAFAEIRLSSTEVEPSEAGLDARQSGTVVHRALEIFWNEAKTQSALRAMSESERFALLDRAIAEGIEKAAAHGETPWDTAYLQTQGERLRRLLRPWLELEMERHPFEVKLSEKSQDDVHVGPLRLRLRIDRIDLVDGGEVLIDYKTGSATPAAWLSERPDEPQLPLYATLSNPEQLKGVAFGLVRAGEKLDLTGYCTSANILPHSYKMKASSLKAQVDDWQRVLNHLATEFFAGTATVAPKKYPVTCQRCAQRILCRLNTSLLEDNEDTSAEGDSLG